MMIGGDLPHPRHREAHGGRRALVVDALDAARPTIRSARRSRDISLTVHAGEIVGIAGVSGNGQKELLAALSGERTLATRRRVTLLRHAGGHARRRDARRALGLAFVPEERLGRGAVPEMSLADNALLTAHRDGPGARTASFAARRARLRREHDRARTASRPAGRTPSARSLSGGNLQKFIVGREIRQQPKVLIAAQPTWGVDVGAAAQIRQALIDLRDARRGRARRVRGARRAVRDLRPPRRDRAGPAVAEPKPMRETNAEEIGMLMAGAFMPQAATGDAARPCTG